MGLESAGINAFLQEWNRNIRNIHVERVAGAAMVVVAVHSYSNIQIKLIISILVH
jgi:hypothetical protein